MKAKSLKEVRRQLEALKEILQESGSPQGQFSAAFPNEDNPFEIGPNDEFKWVRKDGEQILPSDMASMHIFYALRMLFNNAVPAAFRVGKFRRYSDVRALPEEYYDRAVNEFFTELSSRDDLDTELTDTNDGTTIAEQLRDLCENAAVLGELGIPPLLNEATTFIDGTRLIGKSSK